MHIKPGFTVSQTADGLYVAEPTASMAEQFPQRIQMGLSGAFLWDLLTKGDCDRAQLIFQLENLFENDVETEQAARDVDLFLSFLREQNLLEE